MSLLTATIRRRCRIDQSALRTVSSRKQSDDSAAHGSHLNIVLSFSAWTPVAVRRPTEQTAYAENMNACDETTQVVRWAINPSS